MIFRTLIAAAAITPLFSSGSWATEMRVRDLQQLCRGGTGTRAQAGMTGAPDDHATCVARILGEIDGLHAMQRLGYGRKMFCLPADAGPREKFRVVLQYMRRHPETMSVDSGMMVAGALAYAYPCPPQR